MDGTSKYPMDFTTLKKGARLTVSQLEFITGAKNGTAKYQFAVLNLSKQIEREKRLMQDPVTCRISRGEIVVCLDAEASAVNDARFNRHRRGMGRAHYRALGVDVGKLTDEQKAQHAANLLVQGRLLSAMRTARTATQLQAHQRTLPGPAQ